MGLAEKYGDIMGTYFILGIEKSGGVRLSVIMFVLLKSIAKSICKYYNNTG